jgi:hypothetical protein
MIGMIALGPVRMHPVLPIKIGDRRQPRSYIQWRQEKISIRRSVIQAGPYRVEIPFALSSKAGIVDISSRAFGLGGEEGWVGC